MKFDPKKRSPGFWLFAGGVTILVLWIATVIPRVVTLKDKNERFLNQRIPAWMPPAGEPPAGVALPDTQTIDWRSLSTSVDASGVRIVDYDAAGQRGVSGVQRNPYNVAAFGVYSARQYLKSGSVTELLLALRQFHYVESSGRSVVVAGESTTVWCADFDLGYQYNARAPWRSAYFQIHSLNALLWATWLTGNDRYTRLALASVVPLGSPVSDGGLAFVTENDGLFFQEVVTTPLHHILNGHLNTLIGLYRFADYTGSAEAREIFERGVRGTIDFLPRYDKYGYSLYSLSPEPGLRNHFNVANPTYHHLHVTQLRTLYDLTGNPIFREYADKWDDESGGIFDIAWTALFIMFKDVMKLKKAL
ncbi:MAG: D-glucuronyl C5-epimerase family protein [Candidatus Krumholzibacteriia bacterium]